MVEPTVDRFLAAVQEQNAEAARAALADDPTIAERSLHAAAALGAVEQARRLISVDPSAVSRRAGTPSGEPLLYLGYSPFHGESTERDAALLEIARLLLDAGADPNTRDDRYGVPVLHSVTGVRSVPAIARLLIDAGANPTDGESVFHAAERFHEDALELLLEAGADLNYVGEWGNTPLYFLLRWYDIERHKTVRQGFVWLLDHGADPNVACSREHETSLHIAARRGQAAPIIRMLLEHRADVNARRADDATAWLLARRGGFDEIASLLEREGAAPQELSRLDELLRACGRGEVGAAQRLSSRALIASLAVDDQRRLPEAAAARRSAQVFAYLAAGFPVDAADDGGATALHYAAINGDLKQMRALLDAGAAVGIRDRHHSSTPLGWACFGADFIGHAGGDHEGCVRALLDAGALPQPDEYVPKHSGVQAALASVH